MTTKTALLSGFSSGKQGRPRQWAPADDRLIRLAHQGHLRMLDLAQILKASLPTIYMRMHELGLPLRNKRRTTRDIMRLRPRSRTTPTAQPAVSKR